MIRVLPTHLNGNGTAGKLHRNGATPKRASWDELLCGALSWAEIDLTALAANVRAIRAHIGPGVSLLAVVKANAYGHGAIPVAQAALAAGASGLAVGRLDEAAELRGAGVTAPILVMGPLPAAAMQQCVALELTPTVSDLPAAAALAQAARSAGRRVGVHLKVDTGMTRFGVLAHEAADVAGAVAALDGLVVEGVYTHFAAADAADQRYTQRQLAAFDDVVRQVRDRGVQPGWLHAANSAATLATPESHLDLVRVGAALYGLHPLAAGGSPVALQPALTWNTRVIRLRRVPAGTWVGYNRSYQTASPTCLATLGVGYGDGYPVALSNRGCVLLGGQQRPIVGRVSMDQMVVDCGDGLGVQEGDAAVLIGRQGDALITAEDVAVWGSTINYEVVTALSARVPRVYRHGGEVVGVRTLSGTVPADALTPA